MLNGQTPSSRTGKTSDLPKLKLQHVQIFENASHMRGQVQDLGGIKNLRGNDGY
jgi:hypothetical protein